MGSAREVLKAQVAHLKVDYVSFALTLTCDLACRHCCTNSPQVKDGPSLDVAAVRDRIDEATALGIGKIGFTGGEPFLRFEELVELVSHAHRRGRETAIATNGAWGRNRSVAEKRIRLLKEGGLNTLLVSYDLFHEEGGACFESIRNISELAREHKIALKVSRIVKSLWDREDQRLIRKLEELGCEVTLSSLICFGAAAVNYPRDRWHYINQPLDDTPGCTLLGRLLHAENGDVVPCCGGGIFDIRRQKHYSRLLKLGNLYEEPLIESLGRAQTNLFLPILAVAGPGGFKVLAQEHGVEVAWPEELHAGCEFCLFAAKSDQFIGLLDILEANPEPVLERLAQFNKIIGRWGLSHGAFTQEEPAAAGHQ